MGAIVIGLITALVGSWLVHATEAPVVNDFDTELYTWIPRGARPVPARVRPDRP